MPSLPPPPGKHHQLKVLLMAIGVALGAVVLVLGLFAYTIVRAVGIALHPSAADLAAMRRARDEQAAKVAKIAKFDVPPGYYIVSVTDLPGSSNVMISAHASSEKSFSIQLTREDPIVVPGLPKSPRTERVEQAVNAMGDATVGALDAIFSHCRFVPLPDDVVPIAGNDAHFLVRGCAGTSKPAYERGTFTVDGHSVALMASGFGDFDSQALHALLRSIR